MCPLLVYKDIPFGKHWVDFVAGEVQAAVEVEMLMERVVRLVGSWAKGRRKERWEMERRLWELETGCQQSLVVS